MSPGQRNAIKQESKMSDEELDQWITQGFDAIETAAIQTGDKIEFIHGVMATAEVLVLDKRRIRLEDGQRSHLTDLPWLFCRRFNG